MEITVATIIEFLGERVAWYSTPTSAPLIGVSALSPGESGAITFATAKSLQTPQAVASSESAAILVPADSERRESASVLIGVVNPRLEFARIATEFFPPEIQPAVHSSAVIDPTSTIGAGCTIGPGVHVAAGVEIGEFCTLESNAAILPGTRIGNSTHIGPNSSIGFAGFGFERDLDGTPVRMPHYGGVLIGDHVEVGANTCIDRGTFGDTVIADHVKIDNFVHVAHNCTIEEGAFLIAGAIIGGGVHVGRHSWVSINASIREQLVVGDDAVVGMAATVTRDVPDGETVIGSPARVFVPPTPRR